VTSVRSRAPAHLPSWSGRLVVDLPTGAGGDVLGGKGASLDQLLRAGLPVPGTSVLTTAAYHRATAEAPLADLLSRLRSGPLPVTSALSDAAREVDEAFLSADLPVDLEQALLEQTRHLRAAGPVAVRSSATTEDLHGASFAGQYRSFLGVRGDQEVLRAVRLTWASLWHPSPRSYRRFRGIPEDDVAMAVIVMSMVDAELSGVAFTTDPGGAPGCLRIEVVHGLAEGLVSGRVTPRVFVAPRAGPRPALSTGPAVLEDVADLALRVEEIAGGDPQDVEWAYDGRRTWLVQARPVTVAPGDDDDGFDDELADDDVTTTAGIAEMLPGVLPVLQWQTGAALLEEAFRATFDDLGALPPRLPSSGRFLRRVRGRATLDLRVLTAVASRLPGGSPEEVEQQYFGTGPPPVPTATGRWQVLRQLSPRRLSHDLRVVRMRGRSVLEGDVVVAAVEEVVQAARPLAPLATSELMAYRCRLLDLGGRAVRAEVAVAAAAVTAYRQLELALARALGTEAAARWAQELTARAGADAVRRRRDRLPHVPPELLDDLLADGDWRAARRRLATTGSGRDLLHRFDEAWARAGSTAVFAGPTWAERPALAWGWARSAALRSDPPELLDADAPLERCVRLLQDSPGWQTRRVLTGQVVDVRISLLRRAASDAVDLLSRRERIKAGVLELGGEVRRVHLELGRRARDAGCLETEQDVDHLTWRELTAVLHGDGGPTLEAVARRRRWVERMSSTASLPQVFHGPPPAPRAVVHAGTRFTGWAASPGVSTGRVRVVTSPDTADLRRGDVLVARTTDASWAPLFLLAGAVVVEEGGPLSHASILARELRLPAVSNVPGIVDRLREVEGQQLTVDGSTGSVVLHAPDQPDGAQAREQAVS
jgi:rifampicin phosphotransferase